ncbi:MAG TPA: UbiA-like polyprenyltransferase [Bacteroidales bacterium]|nr:UbiA-like polyprenyltransferase [Bacteroidales bacterium]HQI46864.1 UbiA-like polyprenyltransferase [Bacteroidales bacterium]
MKIYKTILTYFSLVKFAHTVFALPFALLGFFLGVSDSGEQIKIKLFILVLLCMVFARNAAMGFNRYIDRKYDQENNRTAKREIPAGIIKPFSAFVFIVINILGFIGTTYFINTICFFLSPIALLVILGYSYTKRFTFLCHFILGLGLSLAPIGAYLAVTGYFALYPVLFSLVVLFWVSGFDIFYALQDTSFDKSKNLHSVPVKMGIINALILSAILHLISSFLIIYIGIILNFGILYWIGAIVFIILLIYEHLIVKPSDLSRVNQAFATLNGFASIIFCVFVIAELFVNKMA